MPAQETSTNTIAREKQIIQDVIGANSIEGILLNDAGWDSRVYEVGRHDYFFKFPRSNKIRRRYVFELAALKLASTLTSGVRTPEPLWIGKDYAYFGYEGVKGETLRSVLPRLTDSQKHIIGEHIGHFLRLLHDSKLDWAREVSPESESAQIQRWYNENQTGIAKLFEPQKLAKLEKLVYHTWPRQLAILGSDSVLCHGDFHFENILYDAGQGVGVIDFGDVAYYDRSKDFLELDDDPIVYQSALQAYGYTPKDFEEKIALRQNMIQIINLGFYLGKQNHSGIQKTTEKILLFL